jgi:hypothetical protein
MRAGAISKYEEDEAVIDAAIEVAINRVIGDSFFAKPKQTCTLMGFSLSTYNRAVSAGLIPTTPRGDYEAVSRPVLHALMKCGFGSTRRKSAPKNLQFNRERQAQPAPS